MLSLEYRQEVGRRILYTEGVELILLLSLVGLLARIDSI